jgi:hypothetical protein
MTSNTLNRLLLALGLGSCLLWTACDSTSSATGPTGITHHGLIDACGLLTQAEAAAIFGKPVLKIKGDTSSYITHCTYEGSVEAGQILGTRLSITTFTTSSIQGVLGTSQNVPAYFTSLKSMTAATDREDVAGVGTAAIWQKRPTKLSFYKGDVYVDISYSFLGKPVDTSATSRSGSIQAGTKVSEKI